MFENDYIMRVISQIGVMLRAMLSDLRATKTGQVYETSREALQLLLGLPPSLADQLTADGFVTMLSTDGTFDAQRGRLVAEILTRRAQAFALDGEPARARTERLKAERLVALVAEYGDDDAVAEAEALRGELFAIDGR
ncbi:MAG: DUF6483 family protein [Coriobacteriia bacterium]|nr:DUF6483 family protein [Coriobacteriia bacterium]